MIIVIGAGPAGLATAYYLQQYNLPYKVLEKHTVGYAWQNHYDKLHLHTLKQVSALPGWPMPDDYPAFPSAAQHLAYLQTYSRHFKLNIQEQTEVIDATYNQGWQLKTNQGLEYANALVIATGIWSTPYRPEFEGEAQFSGEILHARDYRNPQPFQGQRVLVVGAGNTGTEIAVDLSMHGVEASIAIRTGVDFVPYPTSMPIVQAAAWFFRNVPRPVGEWMLSKLRKDFSHLGLQSAPGAHIDAYPVVGYELPEAVEAGQVKLYNQAIDSFTTEGVRFGDGQEAPFDAVILATGYRPTLSFVNGDLELSAEGKPVLDRHWRSTRNPHLYCVGFDYPATEGWLQAIGRVTKQAVNSLRGDFISSKRVASGNVAG